MASSRWSLKSLKHFAGRDAAMQGLILEAAWHLTWARLALVFVPFPKLARRMGEWLPAADPRGQACRAPGNEEMVAVARQVRVAVKSAVRHLPFQAVCLPQAMAAQTMLRRRHIATAMHFGASLGGTKAIDAHAWLDAAGVPVTGYPVGKEMTEIGYCFHAGA